MAKTINEWNGITEALQKYPTLRSTVKQAREVGFVVVRHCARKGIWGRVFQHLLYVKGDGDKLNVWTHEELKGYVSVIKQALKRQKDGDATNQTNHAATGV